MVDVAVMLGAPEKEALTQMEKALAFETEVAHVKMSCPINIMSLNVWGWFDEPQRLSGLWGVQ